MYVCLFVARFPRCNSESCQKASCNRVTCQIWLRRAQVRLSRNAYGCIALSPALVLPTMRNLQPNDMHALGPQRKTVDCEHQNRFDGCFAGSMCHGRRALRAFSLRIRMTDGGAALSFRRRQFRGCGDDETLPHAAGNIGRFQERFERCKLFNREAIAARKTCTPCKPGSRAFGLMMCNEHVP